MPLDRARMPGQRHPGFDRLVILIEPGREASHGVHITRGGALQPGSEALRLPLADEAREILRQVDRLRRLSACCARKWASCWASASVRFVSRRSTEPGGPARCQGLARRLGNNGQGSARAAVPRGKTLSLPQAAGIGGDHPIAARITTLAEVAKQPHGGIAARIPAFEEVRFIGVEPTLSVITTAFAPCKRGALEVALDGAQTHPHVLRDGRGRPP